MSKSELREIIFQLMGEESALFMSQKKLGTEIVMPTKELEAMGNRAIEEILAL